MPGQFSCGFSRSAVGHLRIRSQLLLPWREGRRRVIAKVENGSNARLRRVTGRFLRARRAGQDAR